MCTNSSHLVTTNSATVWRYTGAEWADLQPVFKVVVIVIISSCSHVIVIQVLANWYIMECYLWLSLPGSNIQSQWGNQQEVACCDQMTSCLTTLQDSLNNHNWNRVHMIFLFMATSLSYWIAGLNYNHQLRTTYNW